MRDVLPFQGVSVLTLLFGRDQVVSPGTFSKMAAAGKMSRRAFWVGDFVVHVLPVLLTYIQVRRIDRHRRGLLQWYHGLVSLGYHLLWAVRVAGGLNLDRVYVRRPSHAHTHTHTASQSFSTPFHRRGRLEELQPQLSFKGSSVRLEMRVAVPQWWMLWWAAAMSHLLTPRWLSFHRPMLKVPRPSGLPSGLRQGYHQG